MELAKKKTLIVSCFFWNKQDTQPECPIALCPVKISFTNPLSFSLTLCCSGCMLTHSIWKPPNSSISSLLPSLPPWILSGTERMEKRGTQERKKQWTLRQDVKAVTFSDYTVPLREAPTLCGYMYCTVHAIYSTGTFYSDWFKDIFHQKPTATYMFCEC